MIKIELSPFDIKDLIELLDYALEKKFTEEKVFSGKFDDTKWWVLRIQQLKETIKGNGYKRSIYRSSIEPYDYFDNNEPKEEL